MHRFLETAKEKSHIAKEIIQANIQYGKNTEYTPLAIKTESYESETKQDGIIIQQPTKGWNSFQLYNCLYTNTPVK
ncbi:MAG: hypothetical protein OQK82_05860 [Candidatus Pacearchaeota archaeon]|nr:hypothetical protein [Candidatus Pacearchaeota archaeon]